MTAIEILLQAPAAQAIGWALIHFIWQGALVGALAAIALTVLRRSDADVRYTVAAIALAVMGTLPVVTAVQTYNAAVVESSLTVDAPALENRKTSPSIELPSAPVAVASSTPSPSSWSLSSALAGMGNVEPWIPVLVAIWLAGVAVLTLRLLTGWIWVQRMKTHGASAATRELQAAVARLSKRLHISRPVRLLDSSRVDVPTVIGWLKPVILLPVSALAGLSQSQVEAILAHELAHIRRHDYLVNLLQALLETLLFYHPAVWWLSGRIRAERENCCDDLAVSLCGDPVAYARALADLEALRSTPAQLAMAATGGHLLARVRRLLVATPTSHDGRGPVWVAGATALLLVFTIGVAVVSNAPRQPEPIVVVSAAAPTPTQIVSSTTTPPIVSTTVVPSQVQPASPAPAAPSAPSAPAAPSVPTTSQSINQSGNHITWSHNGEKLEIRWDGDFEFSDDDTDIKSMTPGSQMRISDGGWFSGRSVELTVDASGKITRRFWVGRTERPFDPEGKQWLSQMLPRFVRESGVGAKGRVARIYKARGTAGVLAEIGLINGSWAKKTYYTELLNLGINADGQRQTLEQASSDLKSDYEMSTLLISQSDRLLADAASRKAFFDAARTIDSDYELRRVFGTALKRGPLDNALLASLLDAARSIDSDYELASLLVQVVKQQSIESARASFFGALGSISSDYERGRVLAALGERTDVSGETTGAMLTAVASNSSDYESANFLLKLAKQPIAASQRAQFFTAIGGIRSDYDKGRVLLAVARAQQSPETILALLSVVKGMSSSYEASRVLQTLAASNTITGAARDAYIDATETLGEYEQGRALSALVRGDRARK